MWEPRRLTTLRAFTACYRESFTFTCLISNKMSLSLWPNLTRVSFCSFVYFSERHNNNLNLDVSTLNKIPSNSFLLLALLLVIFPFFVTITIILHRAEWRSSDALGLHSRGVRFEYFPGTDHPTQDFRVYLQSFRIKPGYYLHYAIIASLQILIFFFLSLILQS
jgi:hypothetical protein